MTKDEVALMIGRHVLKVFSDWQKSPQGRVVVVPVKIPDLKHDEPEWAITLQVTAPWFIDVYYEKGERKLKHITMDEYMGWNKK